MSIRINIPNHTFRAGSTITGTVSLDGDEDVDVQHISITLQARCKTKVSKSRGNSRTTYRGRAPMIYLKQRLFTGPHTLHPGHSWPFTFTFPMQCVLRGIDQYKQQQSAFNPQYGQSLPASFTDSYASFSGSWSGECFVRYELEATLTGSRPKYFSSGNQTSTRQLDFVTFRSIQSPDPQLTVKTQTIECYSLRLQPGNDGPLTFREKIKSMRTSQLPVATFTLRMQLPRVGVVEQSLPVLIQLDHDIERSTTPVTPIVLLKKCSLELQAFTCIRCIRDDIFFDGDEQRDWATDHRIADVDYTEKMDTAPALTGHFDLRDVMRTRVPARHKPTFSTFNIRRTYRLHLKLTVECAQKTFKAEFFSRDFVLLAKDYLPHGEQDCSTSSPEVAPVYQETLGPPPPSYSNAKVP